MAFPYRIVTEWHEDDSCFVARVPAIPGVAAHGPSPDKAAREAMIAAQGALEVMAEDGQAPPPPDSAAAYSGNIRLRLPRSLHRQLDEEATAEGVSLNQWMVTKLAGGASPPAAKRGRRKDR
jgi:predicted RNase H-like HicB family nuclease